ncbi:hypothetical protein PF005_g666 [Phytophthora fragariae]|uniref:Uncharacterized protein n=1 Tax=Phytophthora fragariae TaxID=53985 RepID=A0A6A3FVM1_9STRA|nr:hypothetical protein PF003_g10397 [Phytophthora fragariae]KAE8949559.1 hypothetical protein PF009_g891 [Phytophthora fragariae]KAE9026935.1 hypothetical protein PF011_g2290 [Phytophthora fragariae]KAE9139507.1 hypothetical protein PF010_g555 [Phytophthora fragariae]KAE9140182.1 hypothetical protein PF007_g751 [Phytophthora fragariae]
MTLSPVQTLRQLCLKAIGRHLKHFCNLRLHPSVAQTLSESERQLIYAYDLSRLDVFEAQAFLKSIDVWCVKVERSRRQRHCRTLMPKRVDHAMKRLLRVVLLPPAENQLDERLRELSIELGFEAPSKIELRPPTSSVKNRPRWKSEERVDAEDPVAEGDKLLNEISLQKEVVRYRLPVASVGCGFITGVLQNSGALLKLRLNNCQIADAGAILLASGMRLTKTLQLLDLSNEESVYGDKESLHNEIGNVGVLAIALALKRNQTVLRIDLSGNPIGAAGALGFAEMLETNRSLQHLQLDRTLIRDGAEPLIDAFEISMGLKQLNMQWCALRPGLGAKLASVQAAKLAS